MLIGHTALCSNCWWSIIETWHRSLPTLTPGGCLSMPSQNKHCRQSRILRPAMLRCAGFGSCMSWDHWQCTGHLDTGHRYQYTGCFQVICKSKYMIVSFNSVECKRSSFETPLKMQILFSSIPIYAQFVETNVLVKHNIYYELNLTIMDLDLQITWKHPVYNLLFEYQTFLDSFLFLCLVLVSNFTLIWKITELQSSAWIIPNYKHPATVYFQSFKSRSALLSVSLVTFLQILLF